MYVKSNHDSVKARRILSRHH